MNKINKKITLISTLVIGTAITAGVVSPLILNTNVKLVRNANQNQAETPNNSQNGNTPGQEGNGSAGNENTGGNNQSQDQSGNGSTGGNDQSQDQGGNGNTSGQEGNGGAGNENTGGNDQSQGQGGNDNTSGQEGNGNTGGNDQSQGQGGNDNTSGQEGNGNAGNEGNGGAGNENTGGNDQTTNPETITKVNVSIEMSKFQTHFGQYKTAKEVVDAFNALNPIEEKAKFLILKDEKGTLLNTDPKLIFSEITLVEDKTAASGMKFEFVTKKGYEAINKTDASINGNEGNTTPPKPVVKVKVTIEIAKFKTEFANYSTIEEAIAAFNKKPLNEKINFLIVKDEKGKVINKDLNLMFSEITLVADSNATNQMSLSIVAKEGYEVINNITTDKRKLTTGSIVAIAAATIVGLILIIAAFSAIAKKKK